MDHLEARLGELRQRVDLLLAYLANLPADRKDPVPFKEVANVFGWLQADLAITAALAQCLGGPVVAREHFYLPSSESVTFRLTSAS